MFNTDRKYGFKFFITSSYIRPTQLGNVMKISVRIKEKVDVEGRR